MGLIYTSAFDQNALGVAFKIEGTQESVNVAMSHSGGHSFEAIVYKSTESDDSDYGIFTKFDVLGESMKAFEDFPDEEWDLAQCMYAFMGVVDSIYQLAERFVEDSQSTGKNKLNYNITF